MPSKLRVPCGHYTGIYEVLSFRLSKGWTDGRAGGDGRTTGWRTGGRRAITDIPGAITRIPGGPSSIPGQGRRVTFVVKPDSQH